MTYSSKSVLARAALLVLLGTSLSACQTMDSAASGVGDAFDSINPFSSSSSSRSVEMGPPPEAFGEAPDLASLPARPDASSLDNNQRIANSLAADRARNQYSSEALRGGTETSAAPPPQGPAPQPYSEFDTDSSADYSPASAPQPEAQPQQSVAGALPDTQALPYAAPTTPVASAPAYMPAPAGAQPAVPAGGGQRMAVNPSDSALGFQQSRAPALDASVAQFVPQPILARYRETASDASAAGVATPIAAAAPRDNRGGPDMGGAVVANLDSVNSMPAYYGPGGRPTAVVQFPGDGTALSAAGQAKVRQAAEIFKSNGGQGTIRVVGHASSRTGNMPVESHLRVIFEKSQSRANAVAQALIRSGVPAARVLVEAVGDSQPIYYESMPQGEAGNRRAEIFVEG